MSISFTVKLRFSIQQRFEGSEKMLQEQTPSDFCLHKQVPKGTLPRYRYGMFCLSLLKFLLKCRIDNILTRSDLLCCDHWQVAIPIMSNAYFLLNAAAFGGYGLMCFMEPFTLEKFAGLSVKKPKHWSGMFRSTHFIFLRRMTKLSMQDR